MSRRISEDQLRKAIADKKIDPRATRESRQSETSSPDAQLDHPLIAQGKAMQEVARSLVSQGKAMDGIVSELGNTLKNQGGETAIMVKALTSLIEQNNELIKQMMASMASMHKAHQESMKPVSVKRLPWNLKINRNPSGFTESIDIVPSGD